jgi:2-aminobenzoate-CoA ligase
VEALPRTQTGKLQRFELRRIAQEVQRQEAVSA